MKERLKKAEVKEAAAEKIKPEDVVNFFIEAIKALQEKVPALSCLNKTTPTPIEVAKKYLNPCLQFFQKTTNLNG